MHDTVLDDGRMAHSPAMEGLGLHPRVGWRIAFVMYFVTGSLILVIIAAGALPGDAGQQLRLALLTGAAVLLAPVWHLCERAGLGERWLHAPVLLAHAMLGYGFTQVTATATSAFVLLFLFPSMASAYLISPREAAPHVVIDAGLIAVFTALGHPAQAETVVTVLLFVTFAAATMLTVAQQRLRNIVATNRSLSEVDPLTGIANLRRLRTRLNDELARAARTDAGVTLFSIDLDNFKQVNDRHGHSVGDSMLKAVARAIDQAAAPGDLACRRGGDEFALLTIGAPGRDPAIAAHTLATAIAMARMSVCSDIDPRASIGHVVARSGETAEQVIFRGDKALHEAKLAAHPERAEGRVPGHAHATGAEPSADLPPEMHGAHAGESPLALDTSRGIRPTSGGQLTRLDQQQLDQRVAWKLAALLFTAVPVASLTISLTGLNPELRSPWVIALIVATLAFGPVAARLARTGAPDAVVHLSIAGTTIVTTLMIALTDTSRVAMVDLYLLPMLFAFYYMKPWQAALHVISGLVPFSLFLLGSSYPYAALKIVVTAVVIIVLAGLLGITRRRTRTFAAENVNLSGVDPLTGVANLRRLRTRIADQGSDCDRIGCEMALLMVDLDEFKLVNDRYSHSTGDQTLQAVAHALLGEMRAGDMVARRGGDEFAVVLSRPAGARLGPVVERMERAIERVRLAICPDLTPTASVGTAIRRHGEPVDDLLMRVDLALHSAKRATHARLAHEAAAEPPEEPLEHAAAGRAARHRTRPFRRPSATPGDDA